MSSPRRLLRLFHTTRYLRAGQIAGQIRHRLRHVIERPSRYASLKTPKFPGCRWRPQLEFLTPGTQENAAEEILGGRLIFLNDARQIGRPPRWNCSELPKLWQYNLHYFEYLWALDYPRAKAVALDWIENHPPGKGHAGWEPYPTSLRLVNWCCVFFERFRQETQADADFQDRLWQSIFSQAEWLAGHVETHLMGNHLLENAAALAVLGCCFAGSEADRWRRQGIRILAREIPEQLLPDGMHFERSPMYHGRVLYLLLLLLNTGDRQIRQLVSAAIDDAQEAMSKTCHSDGRIALLNDSAMGVYNEPKQLFRYAGRLLGKAECEPAAAATGPFALPEAGYYGVRSENGDYLICDAGPIGPNYIPGHAHGDIFSFELSLGGRRVIVDSGVYDYVPGEMRSYCRSTRAHNTVEIDGKDQCEFWAAFRVARRGRARDVQWQPSAGGFRLSAWHDGYCRLGGAPRHRREFIWGKEGVLAVRDRLTASCGIRAVSRLHLHPECQIAKMSPPKVDVVHPGGVLRVEFLGAGDLSSEDSHYCPEFGKAIPNKTLAFSASGADMEIGFNLSW